MKIVRDLMMPKHVVSGRQRGRTGTERGRGSTALLWVFGGGKADHYGITDRVMDGEIKAVPVSLHANKDGVSQHLFPPGDAFHCLDPNSAKQPSASPLR